MTTKRDGHGLDEYLALLAAIPERVDVSIVGSKSQADFDRKVRESIDRQHRRARIAGGQA